MWYNNNTLINKIYDAKEIFEKYKELADKEENVIFGGRLANYKYYDMHHVFEIVLEVIEEEFGK